MTERLDPQQADTPDLVPARMVNEFAYCPRLFFLEWVQSRFADNEDTVQGRYVHRAVDEPGGWAPLPGEGELTAARSVTLSSPALGVIAKIDLIEGRGDAVRPVDTKRGSPPATPERAWEPERAQLCVQGLLLREAGYRCDEGVLYFSEARQRVRIPFDEALIARTRELLTELRQVASRDLPPAPLVDSPKCPRCSLVGICLPDEINLLAARAGALPRRLLPRDPSPRPLYVTEPGTLVRSRRGRIEVTKGQEMLHSEWLIDVSQLSVFGSVQVTTPTLRDLFAREVPACWFSFGGWFSGIAVGLPSKHVELRRRQVALAHQGGLDIARRIVGGKVRNARTLLRRNARQRPDRALQELKDLAERAATTPAIESLLGIEGTAARIYLGAFPLMLRTDSALPGQPFSFEGRNRRPPKDAVNCLLSYAYSLLVKVRVAMTKSPPMATKKSPPLDRSVPRVLPPPTIRPPCVGPRPGRGVSPAPRGVGRSRDDQQW